MQTNLLMKTLFISIAILCALATYAQADRGRGRHSQLYVVPAPGPVAIDGHLDDWDLSGQIEMFVIEAMRSTQSAKFAVMYDDEALYLSGEVRDPNPMMNRHDPQVRPHRAWDADACQFRIVVNPDSEYPVHESAFRYRGANAPQDTRDDIVHLLMWHYTDDGSANLQMQIGMGYRELWQPRGLVPRDKFEGTYRKWDDGRGYTFEYRIPWTTVGAARPLRGGDSVAGTVQVHWARPDGLATGGGRSWAYDIMREPGFPFQSTSCWGRLIFTEEGNVPRELVLEGVPPERPLPLEFEYRLPNDGEATVQLMNEGGIISRVVVAQQERPGGLNIERWDGQDNHGEVHGHGDLLPAGNYRQMGTYNPQNLKVEYRFSVHNTGTPSYRTGDGKGGWGGDHGTPQDIAMLDDGLLISWSGAEHGYGIVRTDLTGRKVWGSSGRQIHPNYIATDGERLYYNSGQNVELLTVSDARPTTFPNGAHVASPPPGSSGRITGITAGGGRLYVAYGPDNIIALFNTQDGSLVDTWQVATPGRMALRPDGSLAAISSGQVVSITEGQATPWIKRNIDDPAGIAVCGEGIAYVANRGALQNISVFSPGGEYLRSIGRDRGRPAMGRYDPTGIYMPGGIGVDKRGQLWVAETTDAPKRVSTWNVKNGENTREFFGASSYFAYGHIDPANPNEIYAHNVLWGIDWNTYKTKPITTIWRRTDPNMAPAPNVDAHGGVFRMFTANNGRQFGWGGTPHRLVVLYMRDGDLFRPIAGTINPWATDYPALAELKADIEARFPGRGRPSELFWQDMNDDGMVQPEEVVIPEGTGHILHVDKDLNLWLSCGRKVEPIDITPEGRPIYSLHEAQETPLLGKLQTYAWTAFDDEGSAYTVSVVQRGQSGSGITRWSPDGNIAWRYPDVIRWRCAIALPSAGPGRLWSMTKPLGVAGDFVGTQTYMGVNHIFRRDGMYVGAVLGGGQRGVFENRADCMYSSQPEGQGGSFVMLNINGKDRYFIIHGGHDVKVWEVMGLDTLQDLPAATYVHTEEHVATAQTAYEAFLAQMEGVQTVTIVRGKDALEDAPAVSRRIEGNRGFEARMAYDDENLYIYYNVEAPHGLINSQADPHVIFRGGNLIDIQLATNPAADPDREKPAAGDVRLLVTRKDGEPFAVLFRPVDGGFDGERIVLRSPTGTEPFDRIDVVDSVGLEYNEDGRGFTATVTVPLEHIGLRLTPGTELKLDLGYIFGNIQGARAQRRIYINNNSFSANVVDDVPNESRVEPGEWGKAIVE